MDEGRYVYLTVTLVKMPISGQGDAEEWFAQDGTGLNEYGGEGWELVSVIPVKWGGESQATDVSVIACTAFFKKWIKKQ